MSDTTLNRFIASGTNAERLAFTPSPPTPASGPDPSYIWKETDGAGTTYMWNFDTAAWEAITGSVPDPIVPADGTQNITGALVVSGAVSGSNLSGTNTGDQTSIVGISGTKAQFDTACSDGNFLYVGDVTQYTDEMAQDAVGTMVDASLTYVDATPLLQRSALTGDITAAAGSNTTALANNAVTDAKLRDSAALSVIGRSVNSSGDPADIAAGAAWNVLRRDGSNVLGFGAIDLSQSGAVTGDLAFSNIVQIATDRLLGRDTAATGDIEVLTVGGGVEFTGSGGIQTSAFTGDVTKTAGGTATTIATNIVSNTKFRQSVALSVVGRSVNSTGDVADIAAGAAWNVLRRDGSNVLGFGAIDLSQSGAVTGDLAFSNIAQIATDRLLGRDTAATGDIEALTVGGGIEFTGSGGIQTSAFTGDVTKTAGGTATTIANNAVTTAKILDDNVTLAKIANAAANSKLLGSGDAGSGINYVEITLGTNLSMSGTTLNATGGGSVAWGAITGTLSDQTDLQAELDAKLDDNVSAASKLLGRGDSGSGVVQEITLGTNLSMSGTTLNATGGGSTPTGTGFVHITSGVQDGAAKLVDTADINADQVTYAKIQNVSATDRLLGRDTAAAGDIEELTVGGGIEFTGSGGIQTSAFTGDVTKSAGGTALSIANNAVVDADIRQGAALTVIGRSANSTGNVADIAGTNNTVLRVSGSVLGFGAIDVSTAQITGDLPYANLTQGSALSVLGVTGNATADVASIAAGSDGHILRRSGTALTFGTIVTAGIGDDQVTYAKIQDVSATDRLLGRDTAAAGIIEEISVNNGLEFTGSGGIQMSANQRTRTITYIIDGGGSAITTGVKGFLEIPFDFTITGWTLLADASGSIVIDVWKDTYANFPPVVGDTIAGSEKPTLSSVQKNQDLSLSTWTTAITAGDILAFNVDSATTVTRVTLSIRGTVT